MVHKFEVNNKHRLDNPERRKLLPPFETLQALGLRPGDIMADVGCGIGYFSLAAARLVGPGGKVYALDISPEMLSDVRVRADQEGLHNIETLQARESAFPVADGRVTFCFAAFVLHEAADRQSFLRELGRILNKTGKLAVVEWEKKEIGLGPPVAHRLAKEDVERELTGLGFPKVRRIDLGDAFYALLAETATR